MIAKYFVRKI